MALEKKRLAMRMFAVVGVVLSVSGVAKADGCDAILEQGVRNTYQSLRTNDLRSALSNGFCNQSLQTMKDRNEGGLGLGFVAGDVPIKFDGSTSQGSESSFKSSACANGASSMSDGSYEKLLQLVADPNIVQAWSVCKEREGGFYIDGKLNGSTLVLSLKFRSIGSIYSTKLTSDPVVSGASCEPMIWHKNDVINGSEQFQQCKRFGEDAVTVTVNSDFNGAMFYIPAVSHVVVVDKPPEAKKSEGVKVCMVDRLNPRARCPPTSPDLAEGARCSCNLIPSAPPAAGQIETVMATGVIAAPGGAGGAVGPLPAPGQ